jgi:membrane protein involved in colicin uptake
MTPEQMQEMKAKAEKAAAEKKAAKEAKAAQTAATKAAAKEAAPKLVQENGVSRPRDGSKTGRIWQIADELTTSKGSPAPRKDVLAKASEEGINPATAQTQYGRWRKFKGLKGPLEAPTAPATATPAITASPAVSA